MASLAVELARAPGANLPAPADLSPESAMTLASQLIAADVLEPAIPYLVYALRARPSAFGLCRLAKLCQRRGDVRDAARYYELALQLEPDNHWAAIGRASALSECFDVTVAELVEAAEPLAGVARGQHLRPALFALVSVLRAVSRLRPHTALDEAARGMRELARSLPRTTSGATPNAYQGRLLAALAVLAQLGTSSSDTQNGAAHASERALDEVIDVEAIEAPPVRPQLPAPGP
jgi:tetratricopeptide (TPR) repeat protein